MPEPDRQYLADVEHAYWQRGREFAAALRTFDREGDLARAMAAYNEKAGEADALFRRRLADAQAGWEQRHPPGTAIRDEDDPW